MAKQTILGFFTLKFFSVIVKNQREFLFVDKSVLQSKHWIIKKILGQSCFVPICSKFFPNLKISRKYIFERRLYGLVHPSFGSIVLGLRPVGDLFHINWRLALAASWKLNLESTGLLDKVEKKLHCKNISCIAARWMLSRKLKHA